MYLNGGWKIFYFILSFFILFFAFTINIYNEMIREYLDLRGPHCGRSNRVFVLPPNAAVILCSDWLLEQVVLLSSFSTPVEKFTAGFTPDVMYRYSSPIDGSIPTYRVPVQKSTFRWFPSLMWIARHMLTRSDNQRVSAIAARCAQGLVCRIA